MPDKHMAKTASLSLLSHFFKYFRFKIWHFAYYKKIKLIITEQDIEIKGTVEEQKYIWSRNCFESDIYAPNWQSESIW